MRFFALIGLFTPAVFGSFLDTEAGQRIQSNLDKFGRDLTDAQGRVKDDVFDSWSNSDLKAWLENHKVALDESVGDALANAKKNKDLLIQDLTDKKDAVVANANCAKGGCSCHKGVCKCAQGVCKCADGKCKCLGCNSPKEDIASKANEVKDDVAAKASVAGAKASEAGEKFLSKGKEFYESAAESVVELWSNNKLLEYIHERGIKEPASYTHDQLVKLAQSAKDRVPDMPGGHFGRNWFSSWSRDDLSSALKKAGQDIEGTRKQLVDRVYAVYTDAFNKGADAGKKVEKDGKKMNRDLQAHLMQWKEATFDKWSVEDLKEYVSEFSDDAASKRDDLVAQAKAHHAYYVEKLRPKRPTRGTPKRPHACSQIVSQVEAHMAKVSPYFAPVWNNLRTHALNAYAFIRSKF